MRSVGLALLVSFALPLVSLADDAKKDGPKSDPPGAPVEAKLVAKKATYKLDLGGKSADEFKKDVRAAFQTGEGVPPAVAVALELQLRNTGDKAVQVWVEGDATR